jgi:glycosyltransferase involved in cell wall biosynthesis
MVRVVHNGVSDAEFEPIAPNADATDIVCLGELRPVKAFDVLIEALALLKASGRRVSATIAGEGPQGAELKALAERLDSRRPGPLRRLPSPRAKPSRWAACWSSPRAPNRCLMWCWRRSRPACRSSPRA